MGTSLVLSRVTNWRSGACQARAKHNVIKNGARGQAFCRLVRCQLLPSRTLRSVHCPFSWLCDRTTPSLFQPPSLAVTRSPPVGISHEVLRASPCFRALRFPRQCTRFPGQTSQACLDHPAEKKRSYFVFTAGASRGIIDARRDGFVVSASHPASPNRPTVLCSLRMVSTYHDIIYLANVSYVPCICYGLLPCSLRSTVWHRGEGASIPSLCYV